MDEGDRQGFGFGIDDTIGEAGFAGVGRVDAGKILIRVDLPAPFWPRSACTSPRRRSKSTWSSASVPVNRLVRPVIPSSACPRAVSCVA